MIRSFYGIKWADVNRCFVILEKAINENWQAKLHNLTRYAK